MPDLASIDERLRDFSHALRDPRRHDEAVYIIDALLDARLREMAACSTSSSTSAPCT